MKHKIMALGICAAMLLTGLALTSPVEAKNDNAANVYKADWHYAQTYVGWGPAEYYGEDVTVRYTAVNKWVQKIKDGDIMQNLKQTGTAEIYSVVTGELLDTRPFECTEKSYDEGMDAGVWQGTWYNVAGNWWSSDLELFDYSWKIPGVYHYWAYNENGDYSWGYDIPGIASYSY